MKISTLGAALLTINTVFSLSRMGPPHILLMKNILKKLFGDNLIQNAPHSPIITNPIETLWAELKKELEKEEQKI